HENRRISLGFNQLQDDPWPQIAKKFAVGTECLGSVAKVLDRGVVVDLDGDIEGFVPATQLGRKDLTDPTGVFNEGDQLPLQVIEFDRNQHKIVLSVSAYYKKRERAELDQFLQKHPVEATQAIGDVMPDELKKEAGAARETSESTEAPEKTEAPATSTAEPAEVESPDEPAPSEAVPEREVSSELEVESEPAASEEKQVAEAEESPKQEQQ
ncbi:MAG: S1 RNA-binding domain-containing protein, partial [Candidatus Zixiibacteriota bacterium]